MASADFSRDSPSQISPPNQTSTRSDEASALQRVLVRLAAQRNRRQIMRDTMRTLAIGAAVCTPLILLHRLYIIDIATWLPLAILAFFLVVGIVLGLTKRIGLFEAARDADAALGLEDRLASALSIAHPQAWREAKTRDNATSSTRLAFSRKKDHKETATSTAATTSFVPALLHDAASRAASLDPKSVYPQTFDKTSKVCAAALGALLVVMLMPNLDILRTPEQKKLAATLQQTGKELDQIAKPILKKNALEADAQTRKLAARMDVLARRMQRGRMSRGEALLGIGELKRDLEKAAQNQKSSGGNNDTQRLQDALKNAAMQSDEGKNAKAELQKNDVERAAAQLEKLADKMERGDMTREDKQKTANDLEKAAKALRESGQSDSAQKLEDAAKALRQQSQGQQNQQGQQKNGGEKNGQQDQQGQKGAQGNQQQNGQQKNGQQQGQQNQKSGNQQNGQQGQNQGQKGQGQNNQQGQQKSQQNGQNQGQQNGQGQQGNQPKGQQNGQPSQGQQGQQGQQNQSGQQGQSGQSPNGQGGDSAVQGGSQALRDMANGMRGQQGQGQSGNSGNSKNLQDMLNKIKEAERNSGGQNSGQGQSPGSGGSMPGQGEGQSVTPGKDLMPSDPKGAVSGGAGLGPRNNAKGAQGGGGVSKLKGARTGDKRRWGDVWSDRLPKTRRKLDKITGKMGANGEMEQLQTQTEAKGGKASAPYYNVYESYKKDAEDAVAREAVPPAYKQPVKDYFESLKP